MNPLFLGLVFLLYTFLIFIISFFTSRKSNEQTYLIGNRASPWYLVAYGMIGASLSGVTFMSVPGWVRDSGFTYLMIILGYLVGYIIIAFVLLPIYYKLQLTSIYSYLEQRFGLYSQKTGSIVFLISRSIGSSLRMFLVINVLHTFVLSHFGVPFYVSAFVFILIILLYTFKGGIKTIVYTDTLQTTFMIAAVVITIVMISTKLNLSITELFSNILNSKYAYFIISDYTHQKFWLKQFFSGIFITIVMTGLDQEMMQKNLTCKSLPEAQKNMVVFSVILLFVNVLFLLLGASLYYFAEQKSISLPQYSDEVFPYLSFNYLGAFMSIVFIIGLISAAYSSADGTITSLTTSFLIDILHSDKKFNTNQQRKIRYLVHFSITFLLYLLILFFKEFSTKAVISQILTIAGYTYGPLLGLFAFGIITRHKIKDKFVPLIAIFSPAICYLLSTYSETLFMGYKFGFEMILINGVISFGMCYLLRE